MNQFKRVELLSQEKKSLMLFINDLIEEKHLDQLEENLRYTEADTMEYIERVAEDEENQENFLESSYKNYSEFLQVIIYQSLIYGI